MKISDQTIYNWRRQDLIDTGQAPGVTFTDQAELAAARRCITELETELAAHRRAAEPLKGWCPPRPVTRARCHQLAKDLIEVILRAAKLRRWVAEALRVLKRCYTTSSIKPYETTTYPNLTMRSYGQSLLMTPR
ncbi:hypothetical protein [Salinispora arenicola]|uniref:hypothetical protein n=1 Tax=Salinispora arenicola TaxID=168697 RepID=UPI00207B0177|nr:hypothetical protein [Salinispora arenicola]MCN0177711.1 hypothetical protein [Salinispora arenicola]